MKFKRRVSNAEKLYDRVVNPFNRGGFLYEKVFTTKDRDIEQPFLDMLSNTHNMGVYNVILVGYRKVPYDPAVLVNEEFGKSNSKSPKVLNNTYGTIRPLFVKMLECLWIKSPTSSSKVNTAKKHEQANYKISLPKKAAEILNTLEIIDGYRDIYHIVPEVEEFLKNQLLRQDISNLKEERKTAGDLFVKVTKEKVESIMVTNILIPLLKDNAFYEDGAGNKRYPYLSENDYCHKTRTNQVKFHVKEYRGKETLLLDTYLTRGFVNGGDSEILAFKQYGKNFYNIFSFLSDADADVLYKKLMKDIDLEFYVKELIQETYKHFRETKECRMSFGNSVPSIKLKENKVFDESEENMDVFDPNQYDDDDDIEDDAGDKKSGENSIRNAKGTSTINAGTIESVLMGFNGVKTFSYYSHIIEYYMRVFIKSGSSKNRRATVENMGIPRALQLFATINQNADMFVTNTQTHMLDVFALTGYKKYLYFTPKPKGANNASNKPYVDIKERFRDYDTEYGLIDSITVKSEETCGLVACVLPYLHNTRRFKFRD